MKPLKIVVGCIRFCYYSMKMNMTISMTSNIFDVNAVLQNHEMLHTNRNWYQLALLEWLALY